jgi:hypothetical protein
MNIAEIRIALGSRAMENTTVCACSPRHGLAVDCLWLVYFSFFLLFTCFLCLDAIWAD